jgi:hypothetical protein
MTNPQDPNQPGQPGGPAPQGWGQPDPNQPGFNAPAPNAAPGWGAPPPQQQPQAQPAWGTPPPPGYQAPAQPGWGAPPPQKKGGHGCLIAFIIVLFIFLLGVGGCSVALYIAARSVGPTLQTDVNAATTELKIQTDLGAKGTVPYPVTIGGHRTWVVTLEPGYEGQANQIACGVVKADLAGTEFAGDNIQIEDNSGTVLATGSGC